MWNVLSLYRSGTLQYLIGVRQYSKIDLLAVQEVRWLGRSVIEKDCTLYYSCDDEKNMFGAGFIFSKHIRSKVINFKPIDMRPCVLTIRGEFKNYSFFCALVPTEERSERQKDLSYETKEDVQAVTSYNINMLSDMNAKLGKDCLVMSEVRALMAAHVVLILGLTYSE